MLNMAGIYRIVVQRTGLPDKFYIGQASILRKRRDVHFRTLRLGTHKTGTLQRAFDKHGRDAFRFEVLLVCERRKEILDFYEQAVVDSYNRQLLYNMNLVCVGSRLGRAMSAETRARIGAGNRGKVRSSEHCEAVRQSNKNRIVSDETRAKRAISLTGNKNSLGHKQTAEHRLKSTRHFIGRKKTADEIARRNATRRAKGWFHGKDERRRRISSGPHQDGSEVI